MRNIIAHLILLQSEFYYFFTFMICFGSFTINVMFASLLELNTSTRLALKLDLYDKNNLQIN